MYLSMRHHPLTANVNSPEPLLLSPHLRSLLSPPDPGFSARSLADEPTVSRRAFRSPSPTLEAQLMPIIDAHKGKVAVSVKHLETGQSFAYHETEVMPTASLIKLPLMVETYRQAAAKKVDLNATLVLRESDKVPGSGILTSHFTAGARLTLRDAVRLMIAFSDNTATNLVLDAVGIGSTAATMGALGYPNTKLHFESLSPGNLGLPGAQQEVRPGKHHLRRDGPALRSHLPQGSRQPER